jgi:hypothetical protein
MPQTGMGSWALGLGQVTDTSFQRGSFPELGAKGWTGVNLERRGGRRKGVPDGTACAKSLWYKGT